MLAALTLSGESPRPADGAGRTHGLADFNRWGRLVVAPPRFVPRRAMRQVAGMVAATCLPPSVPVIAIERAAPGISQPP